jgi:spermidine synthase
MRALRLAVFLVSASALVFEIALTRVFSVAQWYHFAFMTVSLALLGLGASGTFLSLLPRLLSRDLVSLLATISLLFSVAVLGGYLVSNYVPFDSYQIAIDQRQIVYLAVYYLSLAVPFFFSGLAVAVVLASSPQEAGKTYFANLLGSGLGCPAALLMLALAGGEATVVMAALLGAGAAWALSWGRSRARLVAASALIAVLAVCVVSAPRFLEIRLSPYKALSNVLRYPDAEVVYRGWNAFSRVDVAESESIRSAAGLSYAYAGDLPSQKGIFTDGEDLSPLTASSPAGEGAFLDYLLVSLPYRLLTQPRVLVIEPGAGQDVMLALREGASEIVAVESNPLVVELVRSRYPDYAGPVYSSRQVTVVTEDARSYLRRSPQTFDLIQLSLADSYRPVGSGAYSLSENYLYTSEAFEEYLDHLRPGGLLMVHRWLQTPPSESLRVLALAVSALQRAGGEDPARHVVALRSLYTGLLLIQGEPFTGAEMEAVKRFAEEKRFDLVYYPGISAGEANRFGILEEPYYYQAYSALLEAPDRASFYASYPFDVTPPSDDRPFFFHFFRWAQTAGIIQALGKTWQPFGGSGYLVLLALLGLALVASLIMVILPLTFLRQRGEVRHGRPLFFYFLLLGVGYLFVEIPLLQRFILFLSHPVYAFATVLFSLLVFSGLGSMTSKRLSLRKTMVALIALLACYPLLLPHFFAWLLGAGLFIRGLASVLVLAPLGFLMGVPFPAGIELTGRISPGLVPWAWAVNGCASVLSSILAVMIAISWGFSRVLAGGVVAYALAFVAIYTLAARHGAGQRHDLARYSAP